jgi:Putative Ig domain
MDSSILKTHASRAFAALLALTVCTGIAQATNKLTVTGTPTLTCDTHTGTGTAGTLTVKASPALTATSTAITVTATSAVAGVTITPPSNNILVGTTGGNGTSTGTGLTFTVNITAAGCVGINALSSQTLVNFFANATTDAPGTGSISAVSTSNGSGLSVGSTFTVTCLKTIVSGGSTTYAPGPAVAVPVASTSNIGTPFTVDNSTNAPPSWLAVTPLAGGTATTTTPVGLSIVAAPNCGGLTAAPSAGTVTLNNLPGTAKTFAVNMTFTTVTLSPSPLVPSPSPASLTYVKGSGSPGHVDVSIGAGSTTPAPFFTVDLTTLPNWLMVDSSSGTAGKTVRFSSTTICDSLAPGTYTASVGLKVSGSATYIETISLLITNSAPKLTISGGLSQSYTWAVGSALPSAVITAVSSDSPIPYTVTTGGQLAPTVNSSELTGLAYSFGTPITIAFSPLQFAAAQPGSSLSGTVSLTWGSPAVTTVVTLTYNITAPGSSATGLSPASLPTSSSVGQQFPVTLSGTGFVVSTDPTQKTKVGIVTGSGSAQVLTADPNILSTVVDSSHITLTIIVPSASSTDILNTLFAPSGTGGSVTIGVCNPNGASAGCTVPTNGTVTLSVGASPIIQAVSSASTFAQVTAPAIQTIAPYDMLSIFGSNFCSQYAASGSQGCSSTTVLTGTAVAPTLTYPISLSPDLPLTSTSRLLTVGFWPHGSTPTAGNVIAYAPILFATNNQINILAPSALNASVGSSVDMYVGFGYSTGVKSSQVYVVNIIPANPGIYTVGADGQGGAAALGPNYSVINAATPAAVRLTSGSGPAVNNSDIVQLYVTGLGVPDSTGSNSTSQSTVLGFPATCVSTSAFLSALNTAAGLSGGSALTTLDGTVIQSALLNSYTVSSTDYFWAPPCMATATTYTATVGGVAANVTYAGWVADSIAGLYQVNVQLPPSASSFVNAAGTSVASSGTPLATPTSLPVVITASTGTSSPVVKSSQVGVTIPVTPRLLVSAPTLISGTVGVLWCDTNCTTNSTSSVVASLSAAGSPSYSYALTAGLLPTGLTLSGATGAITGEPAANTAGTYTITVTATDNSPHPLTGSVTFQLTVAGGLFVTSSGSAPYSVAYGSNATVTTVTATGGSYPYTYSITQPGTIPAGIAIGATSGVLSMTNLIPTPAGSYAFQITATDSTLALTGSTSFTVNIPLNVTHTAIATGLSATTGNQTVTTMSTTGQSGTITYTLDAASLTAGFTITNGVVSTGTAAQGSYAAVVVTATDSTGAPGATSPATRSVLLGTITIGA